jgi:hypothetical protein
MGFFIGAISKNRAKRFKTATKAATSKNKKALTF